MQPRNHKLDQKFCLFIAYLLSLTDLPVFFSYHLSNYAGLRSTTLLSLRSCSDLSAQLLVESIITSQSLSKAFHKNSH